MPRWGRAALALQPVRLEQSDGGRTSVDGRRGRPPEVAGAPVHLRHRPRLVLPLRRALELDPNYTPALLGSGKVSLRAGRHLEALALARQVLAREPRNVEALLVAGLASTGMNAGAQAATFFDQALTLQPQSELQKAIAKLAPDGVQGKR